MTRTPSTEAEEGVEHLKTGSSVFSSPWYVTFPMVQLRDGPKPALQAGSFEFSRSTLCLCRSPIVSCVSQTRGLVVAALS